MSMVDETKPRWSWQRGVELLFSANMMLSEAVMLAMVILITVEIVSRSFFGFSLEITDEVSGYLLVAITFLGINASMRSNAMFRVEFLFAMLSPRGKIAATLVFYLLSLGFAVPLDYQFIRLVMSSYERNVVAPTLLATPQFIPQLVMPVGMTLLILELLLQVGAHTARLLGPQEPSGSTEPTQ